MAHNPDDYFPPDRFVKIPNVAIFTEHERLKNGKKVKVTKTELEKMAVNHNRLWDDLALAAPISLGHTLDTGPDGAEVPETEQPPVVGNTLNHIVGKLPDGRDTLFADLYVRREHENVIRDWPGRSIEFYPNRCTYYPLSLLRSSAPELELPVIRYEKESLPDELKPYKFHINEPLTYSTSQTKETMTNCDPKDMKKNYEKDETEKKPEDAAMDTAAKAESKGAKESDSKVSDLEQKVNVLTEFMTKFAPVLEQLASVLSDEGGENDLMQTDGAKPPMDDKKPSPMPEKGESKPEEKDERKSFEKPVSFEAGMGSSTNGFVAGDSNKKDNYKMSNEEVVKFRKQIEDEVAAKYKVLETELAATKKVADQLNKDNRLAKAKEMVKELEEVHNIKYKSDAIRQKDIEIIAKLTPEAAKEFVEMAKDRYERKLPDSASVKEVAKYAVEGEPDVGAKTPEEAWERAQKILQSGLSREEWYRQQAASKKQ